MGHVFISYSRQQSELVDRLVELLASRRVGGRPVEVWRDVDNLRAGEEWDLRIIDAIRGASLVVVLQSKSWRRSGPCRKELDQAQHYHRPVIELDAERLHQRLLADPEGQGLLSLQQAADDVAERLAQVREHSEPTAEIETRAATWLANGQRGKDLAHRGMLFMMRRVARHEELTDVARLYVRSSTRRAALHMLGALLAAVLVAVGSQVYQIVEALVQGHAQVVGYADETVNAMVSIELALQSDPQRARELALSLAEAEQDEDHLVLLACQMALSTKLPREATQAEAADFAFPEEARSEDVGASGGAARLEAGGARIAFFSAGEKGAHARAALGTTVSDIALSPNERLVAALSSNGVYVYDTVRGDELATLAGAELGGGGTLSWSADGTRVGVRTSSGAVVVWDVLRETSVVAETDLWLMDCAELGGGRVALLARDGSIAVVDAEAGELLDVVQALATEQAVEIAPAGEHAAYVTAWDEGHVSRLWRVDLTAEAAELVELPRDYRPLRVAAGPEGSGALALSDGSSVLVLDAHSLSEQSFVEGLYAQALAVDEEGRTFVGTSPGVALIEPGAAQAIWPSGEVTMGATARSIAVSSRGTALVVGDGTALGGGSLLVSQTDEGWALSAGLVSAAVPLSDARQARACAASPDGSLFAVGLSDGTVAFLDADGRTSFAAHEIAGEIRGISFDSSGEHVIVATRDGQIARVDVNYDGLSLQAARELLRAGR